MPQGTIKKLIADKGFGFIQGERGDLFFHHSAVEATSIQENQTPGYDLRFPYRERGNSDAG
jgi:CspA family cold shock protein